MESPTRRMGTIGSVVMGAVMLHALLLGNAPRAEAEPSGSAHAASPRGRYVAWAMPDGRVLVADRERERLLHVLRHGGPVEAIAIRADASAIAAAWNGAVHVWDMGTACEDRSFPIP